MKEKKNEVKKYYYYNIDRYSFEGDISEVVKFLNNLPEAVKVNNLEFKQDSEKYTFIRYELNSEKDYDDYLEFKFYAIRLETNEEFNKRIESNKKAQIAARKAATTREKNKIEEEKKLFEILSKKYGR